MFPLGDLIGETNEALYRGFRDYSKDNLYAGAMLGRTPILGDWLHGMEEAHYLNDYITGRGISKKDIQYPFRTLQSFEPTLSQWFPMINRVVNTRRRKRRYHGRRY